ncbi:MAG: alpha/beta hydrolase [Catenulispora sp.]|nr:alpha/beta hydrolase [Catenulispora sp.]
MTELLAPSPDGHPVAARATGSGPRLLVVHPGGGDISSWDAVADLLNSDFRVVRTQRRIYAPGATVALPHTLAAPHTLAVEAADILAVTELLEPPIVLVGHSSGGVAALEAALAKPSAFAGLVLYEPPMPTRELVGGEAVVRARAVFEAGDPVEAMRIHLRDIVRFPAAEVDAMLADEPTRTAFAVHAGAQIADAEAIDALGVGTDRYAALDLPTVLIEGDASPAHLRERLADLAKALPNAEVLTLAGQGHVAHLTAPELLAATVRDAARRFLGDASVESFGG